jgi:predicted TIM-barrel fold metal-dependent hydrolase
VPTKIRGVNHAPVIDFVCNLYTRSVVRRGLSGIDPPMRAKLKLPAHERDGLTMRAFLAKLDRAGITRALLVAPRAGDLRRQGAYELPYREVAKVCERHPDRFSGLAGIDPFRGIAGLRELRAAVREDGFVGAHLYPHFFGLAPDHAKYYPYYATCAELGIPIMMQMGQNMISKPELGQRSVARPICLDAVAIDFPELTIIGMHVGVPWVDELISMAWKHDNVYIGADAYAPRYWPPQLVRYADSYGRDKVLFGSGWPIVDPERAVAEALELQMRPASLRALMHDNARRVFRLP